MPYSFLDEIAIADTAFEAWGKTREEMFAAAADALANVMVADLETIRPVEEVDISLENETLDMLLFDLLGELIYYKDSRLLLLRIGSLVITTFKGIYTLRAIARGERLDPARHPLSVDVKAVTLHLFSVEETKEGWRSVVVLDI